MQRDEILALEGRELDAAVAEQFFGWKWFVQRWAMAGSPALMGLFPPDSPDYIRWNFSPKVFREVEAGETFEKFSDWDRCGSGSEARSVIGVPRFSTDRTTADQVLAEIKKRGLQTAFADWLKAEWCVSGENAIIWRTLDATPAQICRAALLAAQKQELES